jgi:pyruvate dehydrogenase E1 component
MFNELGRVAKTRRTDWQPELSTHYVNTIDGNEQPEFSGDLALEERLASLMCSNALELLAH